jgi:hypothetical protein
MESLECKWKFAGADVVGFDLKFVAVSWIARIADARIRLTLGFGLVFIRGRNVASEPVWLKAGRARYAFQRSQQRYRGESAAKKRARIATTIHPGIGRKVPVELQSGRASFSKDNWWII